MLVQEEALTTEEEVEEGAAGGLFDRDPGGCKDSGSRGARDGMDGLSKVAMRGANVATKCPTMESKDRALPARSFTLH